MTQYKQNQSQYKLHYKPPNNENENRSKSPKNCKRNIWLNPPFAKNVSNNIGKYFLLLIQKHFPKKFWISYNKNNVKISYSCMANIKSIINRHNKEVTTEKKTVPVKFNCIDKSDSSFPNQCQITSIIIQCKNYIKSLKLWWKNMLRNQRRYI